ncbi:MAG: hypothetical protein JW874_06890 [Spirochaetales bacterium]|nr:hypothetical protein [Spirochaetales bacterium]
MKSARTPFILSSVLQIFRLFFYFLVILSYFGIAGETIKQILRIHAADISFSLALFSGEFALLVLFLGGIVYPGQMIRHRGPVQIYKLFSAVATLMLVFVLPFTGETDSIMSEMHDIRLNTTLILLIALICIDFAVFFVLLLYKEDSAGKYSGNEQDFPDYNEIEIKEK